MNLFHFILLSTFLKDVFGENKQHFRNFVGEMPTNMQSIDGVEESGDGAFTLPEPNPHPNHAIHLTRAQHPDMGLDGRVPIHSAVANHGPSPIDGAGRDPSSVAASLIGLDRPRDAGDIHPRDLMPSAFRTTKSCGDETVPTLGNGSPLDLYDTFPDPETRAQAVPIRPKPLLRRSHRDYVSTVDQRDMSDLVTTPRAQPPGQWFNRSTAF